MKKNSIRAIFAAGSLAAIVLLAALPAGAAGAAGSSAGLWGAAAAKADLDLTIEDMLTYAMQDEYLARAEYVAIMGKYGVDRPFSNIKESEDQHVAWLKEAFAAYKLAVPADTAAGLAVLPSSVKQALEIGVQAEIDNIAMYERFLAEPEIKDSANAALRDLFNRLGRASENHLRSFQNQLARW